MKRCISNRSDALTQPQDHPSYRHPTRDTAAWPWTNGVTTFEVLIRTVRCGCVGELLAKYSICASEPSFERLLNAHAELSAHVALKILRCNRQILLPLSDCSICHRLAIGRAP